MLIQSRYGALSGLEGPSALAPGVAPVGQFIYPCTASISIIFEGLRRYKANVSIRPGTACTW